MARALTPIGVIADMVCGKMGDNTGVYKMIVLQFIALGYQKMHLFLNQDISIKTIVIQPDPDHQKTIIQMPPDFVYETKMALKRDNNIVVLKMNTNQRKSYKIGNDTETMDYVDNVLDGMMNVIDEEVYFYNAYMGGKYIPWLKAYGTGYANCQYYHMDRGAGTACLQLSTILPNDEIVIEYVSDGLSGGVKLVPSEAFLALYYFAKARMEEEGVDGKNQVLFESEYNTLKRLYNFKSPRELVELIFR